VCFRVNPHEAEGQSLYSLSNTRWDILDLRAMLEHVLPDNKPFQELEIEQDFPGVGYRVLLLSGRQLDVFRCSFSLLMILPSAGNVTFDWPPSLNPETTPFFPRHSMEAERIYGYVAHEMIGQPISSLAPPGHEEEMSSILERIRRGEQVNHYETTRWRKDGEIIDVSVTISPIAGCNGVVTGASMVAHDITELKRRQHEALAKQLSTPL
jgi:PAS domain S-box-containing protein